MTLGRKLSKLRKENNYTQEQLASVLGVSRQAISKWESDITYPETDKLIRISDLFNCSLDYLLKDTDEQTNQTNQTNTYSSTAKTADAGAFQSAAFSPIHLQERKSEKLIWGMPLWHVGKNAHGFIAVGLKARGVIAIGLNARGILSLGLLSVGVLSFGMLSVGLLALGMLAIGVLAGGSLSIGIFATGAISLGLLALGALSIGDLSVGALAIGKYFAMGDSAQAMIAVGDSSAAGSVLQKLGELSDEDIAAIKQSLDLIVPSYLSWAKEIVKLFL